MELLDDLRREHVLIESTLGALRTYTKKLVAGEATIEDLVEFEVFFRVYAGAFHHEAEERLLIPLLESEASLPVDRGPIAVILNDHTRMFELQNRLWAATDPVVINKLAIEYSHSLWQHIDIENFIFFPAAESELKRAGVHEFASHEPTDDETRAAAIGAALALRHPPMLPDAIRGDGCVMCHAYGDTCNGLEAEWWNEFMWDELAEHVAAG